MDDKIEAWRNGLLQLVLKHARLYSDHEDAGVVEAAYVAICDYLRTTPEGYRLVPVEPTEAMTQNALEEIDEHGYSVTMGYISCVIEDKEPHDDSLVVPMDRGGPQTERWFKEQCQELGKMKKRKDGTYYMPSERAKP